MEKKAEYITDGVKALKCPICEKKNSYYRTGTADYLCRSCGTVFDWTPRGINFKVFAKEVPAK